MQNQSEIIHDLKVIVFRLGDEEYGVDVGQVKSIERLQQITRLPKTPPFVKGIINLRGSVIPIIELRGRFGLIETDYTDSMRIIVVSVAGLDVGLIVDSANDVIDIPVQAIEPPPSVIGGIEAVYLRGIAKLERRLLILLNMDRILNVEELQELEQLEEK
ncbi:MAG TPA: chemotaxis protein CheW [Bacillota bacterium]|nr:chemotaxis protein CheW [Bacillota bacterium]